MFCHLIYSGLLLCLAFIEMALTQTELILLSRTRKIIIFLLSALVFYYLLSHGKSAFLVLGNYAIFLFFFALFNN